MRRGRKQGPRHRPFVAAGVFACALAVFALGTGQLVGLARCEVFTRRVEAMNREVSVSGDMHATRVSWSFAFGDKACTVDLPVYRSEIEHARAIDTGAVFKSGGKLREDYVARLARAQSRSAFIERLAGRLREEKASRSLNDDHYLDLLVRAVQSIPFGSQDARMRLPVEVVASGYGVCSEKSFLLAALMLHEGYDTAFWWLETQNHVAPGVASNVPGFRGTGYAFIETTKLAYIGEVSEENRAAGPLARPPQLIRLGGTKRYETGDKVEYVLGVLERSEAVDDALGRYVSALESARVGSEGMLAIAQGEQQSIRRRIAYLRGQSDEPAAAYEHLMKADVSRLVKRQAELSDARAAKSDTMP